MEHRIHMVKLTQKWQKHKIGISILVIAIVVVIGFICLVRTRKVNSSNFETLAIYQNTYIGDAPKVNAIIEALPYSNHKTKIELQTEREPYGLTIHYNMKGNQEKLQYNSFIIFSLVQNVDTITYSLQDEIIYVDRNDCEQITQLTLEGVKQQINHIPFGSDQAYEIHVNERGWKVFVNPDDAFKAFLKDYKQAITFIKNEFQLLPLTKKDYQIYKTYAWQTTVQNEELRQQIQKISSFLDIYENSNNQGEYDPVEVESESTRRYNENHIQKLSGTDQAGQIVAKTFQIDQADDKYFKHFEHTRDFYYKKITDYFEYEKYRFMWNGVRELTKDDFVDYFLVLIIYGNIENSIQYESPIIKNNVLTFPVKRGGLLDVTADFGYQSVSIVIPNILEREEMTLEIE